MTEWRTTVWGIFAIIVAVLQLGIEYLSGQTINYTAAIAQIGAGIGLIKAADAKKN